VQETRNGDGGRTGGQDRKELDGGGKGGGEAAGFSKTYV
jgi:hypothetical protein